MKVKIGILIFFVCICVVGCGNNSDGSSNNSNTSGTTVITSLEGMTAIEDFSGSFDYEYIFETDCQTDLGEYAGKAYTSDGYYMWKEEYFEKPVSVVYQFLKYYDYATEQEVYVCGKSNCQHNDSDCDAYFDELVYQPPYLWYYDGYLYAPMNNEDYLCICKISPDGSTRENVCNVFRLNIEITEEEDGSVSEATYYPHLWIHRGYVYYSTTTNVSPIGELGRIKLDGTEEAETICSVDFGDNGDNVCRIIRVKPYGQYIFFKMGYYNEADSKYNLYVYDTESNDGVKKVCDDCGGDYTIINNKLYYYLNGDIYVKDMDSGETKFFFDIDTENTYMFDADREIFAYEDYLVLQLTDTEHYEYNEETYETYRYVYQLIINQDGELAQTLQPDDEKISPY